MTGIRIWSWLLAPVVLAGCTISPLVVVYNHTSDPIRVFVEDAVHVVEPAESESLRFPTGRGEVRVCLGDSLLRYSLPSPPLAYYATGLLRGRIRVQIDADARISILHPDQDFPLLDRDRTKQPDPFPLTGQPAGACPGSESA